MRLRMLKLSVGKGRQVMKQLCLAPQSVAILRYSGYRARGVCALVTPRACARGKVIGCVVVVVVVVVVVSTKIALGQAKLIISFSSYVQEFPQAGGWLFILFFVMNIIKCHHEFH